MSRSAVKRHLAHQVAGDQHRAALVGERAQQLADPPDAFGVEPVDRLVEEEGAGVAEQRGGDAEALAHPEREPARATAGDIGEADHLEHLVDAAAVDAVGIGHPAQVIPGATARVDRLGLEEGADVAEREAEVAVGVAVDGDLAGRGGIEADHHPHGGRLAGTVGAEEAGDLAGTHLEAEVVDGDGGPVALRDVVELDHHPFVSSWGAGPSVRGASTGVSDTSGMPTSRTFCRRPCSAAWSTTDPRRTVVPSSSLVMLSPSNQAAQRVPRCPSTRISYCTR